MKIQSEMRKGQTHNRRLAQLRVTWLIEYSTSHQLLWCIDSFVPRNPPPSQRRKTLRASLRMKNYWTNIN